MTPAEQSELEMLEFRVIADLPFSGEDLLRLLDLRQKQADYGHHHSPPRR